CDLLYIHPSDVTKIEQIPFLPIQFFKTREVLSSKEKIAEIFTSSGTTGSITSKHLVTDINFYKDSYLKGFAHFYGNIEDYVVLALLPNYLERKGSSLVFMVDDLIAKSKNSESGFYLNNFDELAKKLINLDKNGQKVLLIGVSFALLDLIEKHQFNLKNTIVMETGGMKGRRKELIRNELHQLLKSGFKVDKIHSEYGMTELLSQAYSKGNGIFETPNWMQILTRDTEDALTILDKEKTGGINVIDLANYNSCSFIATQDLGKVHKNGTFEIIGRFDNSDIRGCNLMVL
ncbi:MAG: acyl transferase, partial [Flavobacteriales bacterium]